MESYKERTKIVIGEEGSEILKNTSVLVFGLGGVGSFVAETLVRAGIGNLTIVDFDKVDETNINRQIPALYSNIDKYKVDVMRERLLDINPELNLRYFKELYDESTSDMILDGDYDYVVDAIDMMKSKIHLINECYKRGLKIISSMGMANKLDPTQIEVTDIYKTEICPMAKILRRELKKLGVKKLRVVYSTEKPSETGLKIVDGKKKRINGSVSFVPPCSGIVITSQIVRHALGKIEF